MVASSSGAIHMHACTPSTCQIHVQERLFSFSFSDFTSAVAQLTTLPQISNVRIVCIYSLFPELLLIASSGCA